jgi:hypothetical protein
MCIACRFQDSAFSSKPKQTESEAREETRKLALAMARLRRPLLAPKKAPTFFLYRGDDRRPGQIKRDGFDWWPQAAKIVKSKGGIANYIADMCNLKLHGKGVAEFVRVQSDPDRPTVSCTNMPKEAFSRNFVYEIEASGLTQYNLDGSIMEGCIPALNESWISNGLVVFMDSSSLSKASIILMDIKLETHEHDFFTKVEPNRIKQYRASGGKALTSMSSVKVWEEGQTEEYK